MSDYALLDSGQMRKLERFGPFTLIRPSPLAIWSCRLPQESWEGADATFSREEKKGWAHLPASWPIEVRGVRLNLKPTAFGHLGIFPEHAPFWATIQSSIAKANRPVKVLNLFAYSGGATVAAALAGAEVCHVDAAKGMVSWATENAELNGLHNAPIRWIVDDAKKFMVREVKRKVCYDAIILDPPTFGRGSSGQVFKIEKDLNTLLALCKKLLSPNPLFVLLSCHTPGFNSTVLKQIMDDHFSRGHLEANEMVLKSGKTLVPSGSFARWMPQ